MYLVHTTTRNPSYPKDLDHQSGIDYLSDLSDGRSNLQYQEIPLLETTVARLRKSKDCLGIDVNTQLILTLLDRGVDCCCVLFAVLKRLTRCKI